MKENLIPVFCVFVACAVITHGQTNFYQEVSGQWLAGQKSNVLGIAQQGLAQDTNDLAGLILKLEYEFAFLDTTNMVTTAGQVLNVGAGITTTNFQAQFPIFQASYEIMTNVLSEYTSEEIAADREKASITNKPMSFGDLIKALQDDGYFQ